MREILLPFGVRDGVLQHVSAVPSGLACGCRCPGCGAPLVARKGGVRVHHFAHLTGTPGITCLETALHLAAKQILLEEKRFALPPITLNARVSDAHGTGKYVTQVIKPTVTPLDTITTEKLLGTVRPDLVATRRGRRLFIEIAVTHRVEPAKVARIASLGIAAVEVSVAHLRTDVDFAALRRLLVEEVEAGHKRWLFNPREAAMREALIARTRAELARTYRADQAGRRAKQAQLQAKRTRRRDRKAALVVWKLMSLIGSPPYRVKHILQAPISPTAQLAQICEELGVRPTDVPEVLNHPVPGEVAFRVPRQLWQAALFAAFLQRPHAGVAAERVARQRRVLLTAVRFWATEFKLIREQNGSQEEAALTAYLAHLRRRGYLSANHTVLRDLNGSVSEKGSRLSRPELIRQPT